MSETLRFDLLPARTAGYRLAIAVPRIVWERHQADDALTLNVAKLTVKRHNAVVVEDDSSLTQLLVNDKKIGASTERDRLAQAVCSLVAGLNSCAAEDERDPTFVPGLSRLPTDAAGRYRMRMQIRWPASSDQEISEIVTARMQESAVKLRYSDKKQVPTLVYGLAERNRGVTLETNDIGSCQVSTDGSEYKPSKPTFSLYDHNLYTPVQQLICLVGGVALARADSLVSA